MNNGCYDDPDYRQLQSRITKQKWQEGVFARRVRPLVSRNCIRPFCQNSFSCKPYDKKSFCSSSCAAIEHNTGRPVSEATRQLKSRLMKLKPISHKGEIRVPRQQIICRNKLCGKILELPPYLARTRKYCSNACAMKIIGGLTTSPKASKGKPGIRPDISETICFYSTWEANYARVLNLLEIKWEYAPNIFDLGEHTYRPDFYLPDQDLYVEVKNFMNEYSATRDRLFREKYPKLKLIIFSKEDYLAMKTQYQPLLDNWEIPNFRKKN